MNDACHIWISHGKHMKESWHTYEWVMAHMWISHGTHMNESQHTYEWVMAHIRISSVTRVSVMSQVNVSHERALTWRNTNEWVLSHMWMSHVTYCHTLVIHTHIHSIERIHIAHKFDCFFNVLNFEYVFVFHICVFSIPSTPSPYHAYTYFFCVHFKSGIDFMCFICIYNNIPYLPPYPYCLTFVYCAYACVFICCTYTYFAHTFLFHTYPPINIASSHIASVHTLKSTPSPTIIMVYIQCFWNAILSWIHFYSIPIPPSVSRAATSQAWQSRSTPNIILYIQCFCT